MLSGVHAIHKILDCRPIVLNVIAASLVFDAFPMFHHVFATVLNRGTLAA